MREISPIVNVSADDFLKHQPSAVQELVKVIRQQKVGGTRPRPSLRLVDKSSLLTPGVRADLLDAVAALVDENLFGRAEMCLQFADLLYQALAYMGLPARPVLGNAIYFVDEKEIFRWKHAWVRVGREVIDGNVDSLYENPLVPPAVNVAPYWGPIKEIPGDRHLQQHAGQSLPHDSDVEDIWWPEIQTRLNEGSLGMPG